MQYFFSRLLNVVGIMIFFSMVVLTECIASTAATTTMALCEKPNISCAKTVTATVSPAGRILFAWTVDDYLYVNYSDDRGNTLSHPIKVNRTPEKIAARGEKRPKISVDSRENVYVSWIKKLPQKWTSDIRFSWLKAGEEAFSSPITVNNDSEPAGHSFNEMTVTDTGDVTIVWLDSRHSRAAKKRGEPYVGSSIYWATINPVSLNSLALSERETIKNTAYVNGNCVCCRLALTQIETKAGKSESILMWRHIFGDNIRDHALGVLGEPLRRVSFEKWQVDGCPHHGPSISVQGNGIQNNAAQNNAAQNNRLHMSWFNDAPNASGLFYAYTDDLGETVSPAFHFAQKEDSPGHPSLIAGGDGKLKLAWQTFDGVQSSIYIMTSIQGEQWSDARVVAQFTGQTDYPFLLRHPEGDLLLWHRPGHALMLYDVSGHKKSQQGGAQ